MITEFTSGAWSPYVSGFFIGVLTWLTFHYAGKPVGASSSYASVAGMIGKLIAPRHTLNLSYYQENPPGLSWELVFVLSTIAGSFLAASSGGEFEVRYIPELWASVHSSNIFSYGFVGFCGGVLMAFGARMADGCTSGHGISGTLQLSVASWITVICFFLSGILFIRLLY